MNLHSVSEVIVRLYRKRRQITRYTDSSLTAVADDITLALSYRPRKIISEKLYNHCIPDLMDTSIQVHDVEYSHDIDIVVNQTLPALDGLRQQNKVRNIGITGYPLKTLKYFFLSCKLLFLKLSFLSKFKGNNREKQDQIRCRAVLLQNNTVRPEVTPIFTILQGRCQQEKGNRWGQKVFLVNHMD